MKDLYVLWGGPLSLYTGKVRSYLIKKGIPFREYFAFDPTFQSIIASRIGFLVVPVVRTPDGEIIQDTSDIIEHLAARFPEPGLKPSTPVQQTVAALICAFGSEALLKTAMHYRWSYLGEQENFLRAEFGRVVSPSHDAAERAAAAVPFMLAMQAHLPTMGISTETIPAIERSYERLLDILETHFQQHPYILGGRPSDADFGLMAPLFAHLSRDPVPATLMKNRAPNVFRWTERMNAPGFFDGEFPDVEPSYVLDDAIPETLEPLLAQIFEDWGPELLANAERFNAWVAEHPSLKAGDLVSLHGDRRLHPSVGEIEFMLRGTWIRCASTPHALWHAEKALQRARALSGPAKSRFAALIRRNAGERVMGMTLSRRLERNNYALTIADQ